MISGGIPLRNRDYNHELFSPGVAELLRLT